MISNDRLIKRFEGLSEPEVCMAPIFALQGVSEADAVKMKEAFGIDNVEEMARLCYYKRAKAIIELAKEEK